MRLDYREGNYILRCPPRDANRLCREHGLEYSGPASNSEGAVLFTRIPYQAVAFAEHATPAAQAELEPLTERIAASWAYDSKRHFDLPSHAPEMWGFQRGSTAYALDCNHCLIGDVPGLGKTRSALVVANTIQAERCAVICPASIREQWAARIREWTTQKKPHIDIIDKASRSISPQANWIITSYDLCHKAGVQEALAQCSFDLLVLDELHYAKTGDTRRARAIFGGGRDRGIPPLLHRARKVLALTGTPLPNRPRELYVPTRGLCWDAVDWMSEEKFNDRFNPSSKRKMHRGRWVTYDKHEGLLHEFQARLRANFMVRHTKDAEVSRQIGRTGYPVYDLVHALETGPVRQALAAEKLLDFDVERMVGRDAKFDGQIMTARRLMGEALAPQAADYVRMLLTGGEEKIVVFAWHVSVLDILSKQLDKFGVARVDGSSTHAQRVKEIGRFINDPRTHVILGNNLALGTGVDGLQHVSRHAVIAEPDWTPGNNIQCFDRLDRGGQRRQVQGDILVAPGSIAERVLASALRKLGTITRALDGGR